VRGLDYYRHTAFEFVTDRLGAQGTVLGGGRYDGLIENMGGPATPAVGWAAGIERLAMLVEQPAAAPSIAIIPDRPHLEDEARNLAFRLRGEGFAVDIAYKGNAKRRIEVARKYGADAALFIREPEVADGTRYHLTLLKDDPDKEFISSVLQAIGPGLGGLGVERR
jgi:histidyl-tRNA synthetase